MGRIGSDSESLRDEGRRCEPQHVDGGAVAGGRSECAWDGWGDRCGCADSVGRVAEMDARRKRHSEVLERFGRAFRGQTAEQIEEAVAQAVAEVRAENRREAERQPAPE